MKYVSSILIAIVLCLVCLSCNKNDALSIIGQAEAPTEVTASQGKYKDKVRIEWKKEKNTYYRILRSVDPNDRGFAITTYGIMKKWDDEQVEPETMYYYSIQAAFNDEGDGASEFSETVAGYAGEIAGENEDEEEEDDGNEDDDKDDTKDDDDDQNVPAVKPSSVRASDGDYSNRVVITWNGNGESHFQVYRSTSSSQNGTTVSDWMTSESYTDRDVDPGKRYYYRVKAAKSSSGADASAFSAYNRGFAEEEEEEEECETPTDVEASDGDYANRIRISWDGENCGYYMVYRSTSRYSNGNSITDWIDDENYTDYDVEEDETYYYRVKSAMDDEGEGASSLSDEDSGYIEEDDDTGGSGSGGNNDACFGGLSGVHVGNVSIQSPYTTYYGNDCKIDFDEDNCTFRVYTHRTLSNGTYSPAPKRGDISLIHSSAWTEADDNIWVLQDPSFDAASVWLPVNNLPDQAITIAYGAGMGLYPDEGKIILLGTTQSPYQMDITVTITF